jgi:DNA-binding LytR/AlgR family response regulator
MLLPRVIVTGLSMAITAILYLALRGSSAASIRRSIVAAAVLAAPAAVAYSTVNWVIFDQQIRHEEASAWARPRHGGEAAGPAASQQQPETLDVGHVVRPRHLTPLQGIADNAVNGYFFFVAWAALYLALRYAGEVRTLERRSADLRAAAQSAELRALRYQVNPHFLFNTLNSLSSLVLTDKRERAERMILNLSTFFRHSLRGDPIDDLSLAEEIDLQRLYLDIEAVRFPERLRVEIELPAELADVKVPGMMLQPVVENAVKHAVARTIRPVTIHIVAARNEGDLDLEVWDDGDAAVAGAPDADGTGVGLRNVCDRLAARFGDRASCRWGPRDGGGYSLIVDDEPLAVERLQVLCARLDDIVLVGTATDGLAAQRLMEALSPDLVLLDIAMPGLDGMSLAKRLEDRASRPAIVFCTAYDSFAVDAFSVGAVDYLLKPVVAERLERAVSRVREARTVAPAVEPPTAWIQDLWAPSGTEMIRIPAGRIDHIQAERDYMRLHVGKRSHLIHQTIAELERKLDPDLFIRLHRSSIVRKDFIASLRHDGRGAWQAILADGAAVAIGRSYLPAARALIGRSDQGRL